jgi:glutathione S-transferase
MALIEKNLPYEKEVIDLQNKPDQFLKDAPIGKVPLIYVDDKILFESVVICEYLDEIFPENPLHPQDVYTKAIHRAWIEFGNGILASTFGIMWSQSQEQFDLKKAELISKLEILDKQLKFSPYFDGEKFSLIDICLASAFKPLVFIDNKFTLEIFDLHKNVATYAEGVITRGSLTKALPADYEELFKSHLERKKSHLLTMSFSL